jgi:DNA-binding transcriptional ArsR family regulator
VGSAQDAGPTILDCLTQIRYFTNMRTDQREEIVSVRALKALASETRLTVLDLLKDPVANFPPQVDGDLIRDGVCSDFIREKLGVAPATASRHLRLLTDAGFLIATRKKGWTFYRRDEASIRRFAHAMRSEL